MQVFKPLQFIISTELVVESSEFTTKGVANLQIRSQTRNLVMCYKDTYFISGLYIHKRILY